MVTHKPKPSSDDAPSNGSAIVIVLALLVLLTVLLVAFFSRAITDRQVSNSSVNQTSAELFARSAAEIIVGDLKQEIVAGSTQVTFSGTTGVTNIYTPKPDPAATAPVVTLSVEPLISGVPAVTSGSSPLIPNLIRRSVRASDPTSGTFPSYYSNPPPNRAAPVNSTTDASANGRSVSLARWNLHYLIPTSSTTSNAPISSFAAPDWVLVTSSGSNPTAWSPALLKTGTNPVIGRYAYAIYDEGGLLDANVAGCPSVVTSTGTQSAAKGFAAFADLTALGLSSQQVDNLVGWRNYATTQPNGSLSGTNYSFTPTGGINYCNYILGGTSGFLTTNGYNYSASGTAGVFTPTAMTFGSPARTDQIFPNRQALIKFWNENFAGNMSALQYLGTFTRDLNAPNFTPLTNPPVAATLTPPQLTYSGTTSGTNPIVQNVLYTNTTATNCGQPVVSQRFPLSRLALFSNPTANAAAIQQYFGLTQTQGAVRDGYTWNYMPLSATKSGTSIYTLAQVGALAPASGTNATRAPNFFEELQAAVLQGSIACYTSGSATTTTNFTPDIIMQMGANIIDQSSSNAYPTVISFNGQTFAGIKNLPYISEALFWPYRPQSDPTRYTLNGYCMVELWNPHQNAVNISSAPQNLMVTIGTGGASTYINVTGTYAVASGTNAVGSAATSVNMSPVLTGSDSANFNNSISFQEPTVLGTPGANDNTTGPDWFTVIQSGSFVTQSGTVTLSGSTRSGFLLGSGSSMPDHNLAVQMGDPLAATYPIEWTGCGWVSGGAHPAMVLSFQDANGIWHPYEGNNTITDTYTNWIGLNVSQGEIRSTVNGNSPFPPDNVPVANDISFHTFNFMGGKSFQMSDPRTQNGCGFFSSASTYGQSVRPFTTGTLAYGAYVGRYILSLLSNYSMPYSPDTDTRLPYASCPGMLNENGTNSIYVASSGATRNTWIADQDGVIRPGDGAYGGNPLPSGSTSPRPILLGRPFRSVGELGYTDRGYGAWKSINFFSQESGDAGLLDYFSIDQAPISAGKVNLNTRQAPVLQAILQGAYRIEPLGTATVDTLTSTDASNLATAIVKHTTATSGTSSYIAGPLISRADLVRSLLGDPAIATGIAGIQGTANTDPTNTTKTRREAFVRALADVGTTRTWNLLIDVVAQTGNYPLNATGLSQFIVQGEKHYWLHVALDRYTGEITDEQWELVNE